MPEPDEGLSILWTFKADGTGETAVGATLADFGVPDFAFEWTADGTNLTITEQGKSSTVAYQVSDATLTIKMPPEATEATETGGDLTCTRDPGGADPRPVVG